MILLHHWNLGEHQEEITLRNRINQYVNTLKNAVMFLKHGNVVRTNWAGKDQTMLGIGTGF